MNKIERRCRKRKVAQRWDEKEANREPVTAASTHKAHFVNHETPMRTRNIEHLVFC